MPGFPGKRAPQPQGLAKAAVGLASQEGLVLTRCWCRQLRRVPLSCGRGVCPISDARLCAHSPSVELILDVNEPNNHLFPKKVRAVSDEH